jgi:kynureninase
MADLLTLDHARALDAADPLGHLRVRFRIPDGQHYFDGHSLGPPPADASARLAEVAGREWGELLIRSWNESGWIDAPQRVGAKIAALVGAGPDELLVADSTSVNLFKLLCAAAKLSDRRTILTEAGNFHTDVYVAGGAAEMLGMKLEVVERDEIERSIGPDTNLVLLTHVHFKTSERFDMAAINALARDAGARVVWDLSHSAGAVPLRLAGDGAELAVGCGYKYLNGGPGAPAFLYVASHLQERLVSPLRGWMGHAAPFEFAASYVPAPGLARFLAGTPPILSLAALEAGVDAFDGVAIEALAAKSAAMFDLFAALASQRCPELICISPTDPSRRGSHIAFRHDQAFEICQALIEAGVTCDFRAPDAIRFGLAPLYLRFEDVWAAVDACARILGSGTWRDPRFALRSKVT